jgi:hypothetical protein
MTQVDIVVCNHALNLMEFSQMRSVRGFITEETRFRLISRGTSRDCARNDLPEDPINTEQLARLEPALLIGDSIQHVG